MITTITFLMMPGGAGLGVGVGLGLGEGVGVGVGVGVGLGVGEGVGVGVGDGVGVGVGDGDGVGVGVGVGKGVGVGVGDGDGVGDGVGVGVGLAGGLFVTPLAGSSELPTPPQPTSRFSRIKQKGNKTRRILEQSLTRYFGAELLVASWPLWLVFVACSDARVDRNRTTWGRVIASPN
jgi:hypothetical protein